mmetsp:Transcript_22934/g.66324  ORF Transcript_22934/g.66324 Transcript_22934/m.66324 type:complete len:280 (-) Transcript_22934:374-1213(-)
MAFLLVLLTHGLQGVRRRSLEQALHLSGDRLQDNLVVTGVVRHRRAPRRRMPEQLVAQQDGGGDELGGRVPNHVGLGQAEVQKVVDEGSVPGLARVHAREAVHEVRRSHGDDLEVQGRDNIAFQPQDLGLRVGVVRDVRQGRGLRGVDLLVLRGDEKGDDAQQLQVPPLDRAKRQVAVDDVDRQVQRLVVHLVLAVHLDEPIDEDAPHFGVDVRLRGQIIGLRHLRRLLLEEHAEHVRGVLVRLLGVLGVAAEGRAVRVGACAPGRQEGRGGGGQGERN